MAQLLQSMAQLICNQIRYQKMCKQLFPTQSIQDNICFCEDLVTKPTCWELWFAYEFCHLMVTSCSICSHWGWVAICVLHHAMPFSSCCLPHPGIKCHASSCCMKHIFWMQHSNQTHSVPYGTLWLRSSLLLYAAMWMDMVWQSVLTQWLTRQHHNVP